MIQRKNLHRLKSALLHDHWFYERFSFCEVWTSKCYCYTKHTIHTEFYALYIETGHYFIYRCKTHPNVKWEKKIKNYIDYVVSKTWFLHEVPQLPLSPWSHITTEWKQRKKRTLFPSCVTFNSSSTYLLHFKIHPHLKTKKKDETSHQVSKRCTFQKICAWKCGCHTWIHVTEERVEMRERKTGSTYLSSIIDNW